MDIIESEWKDFWEKYLVGGVSASDAFNQFANEAGKPVAELSAPDKQMALLNYILDEKHVKRA